MSREAKTRAKNEAGRIVVEEIQAHLDRSSSPVSGGQFKTTKKDGRRSVLLEFGDLRDAVEFKRRSGDKIEVGVFRSSERGKAFGHNTDFEGHPHLDNQGNRRQFIPSESESFKRSVTSRINEAISNIREFDEARRELPDAGLNIGDLAEAFAGSQVVESGTPALTISLGSLFPDGDDGV